MNEKLYTIEQLSELTGYSRRTIRYYIQQGLLEPPAGRGRGGFYYDSHLLKLKEIRAQQERGIKLAAIQELAKPEPESPPEYERELWIRYPVSPGIEIHIQRNLEERESRRISEIVRLVKTLLKGG
jgi:DNA-binding transcriptional MerR regulator